jgi:hypothetical protein
LSEERQELRLGVYQSEEFEPSLSFRVSEGWNNAPSEAPAHLHIQWEDTGGIGFLRFKEVYELTQRVSPS